MTKDKYAQRRKELKYLLAPAAIYILTGTVVSFLWEDVLRMGGRTQLGVVPAGLVALVCIPLFFRWYRALCAVDRTPANSRGIGRTFFMVTGAALSGAALSLLWGWISTALRLYERSPNPAQDTLFLAAVPLQVIVLGVLAPLCEELLFRGLIYTALSRMMPVLPAALLTSVLFALLHGNPVQMAYAFLMGLCLQVLRIRTGRLLLPAAFHAGANLASVLVMAL